MLSARVCRFDESPGLKTKTGNRLAALPAALLLNAVAPAVERFARLDVWRDSRGSRLGSSGDLAA